MNSIIISIIVFITLILIFTNLGGIVLMGVQKLLHVFGMKSEKHIPFMLVVSMCVTSIITVKTILYVTNQFSLQGGAIAIAVFTGLILKNSLQRLPNNHYEKYVIAGYLVGLLLGFIR